MISPSDGIVLLVVDMQNGFLGSKSHHVVAPVLNLVQQCAVLGIPTVFTRFHNEPGSLYEQLIGWTRLRSAPETEIASDLVPFATTVIDKTIYSSFTPEFSRLAADNKWTTIAICGVATDGCVLKTAVDAFEHDLVPLVVADACASHAGQEVHDAGLMLISRFIGKQQIIDGDEFLNKVRL